MFRITVEFEETASKQMEKKKRCKNDSLTAGCTSQVSIKNRLKAEITRGGLTAGDQQLR